MRLGIDWGTTRVVVAAVDRGNYPVVTFEDPEGTSREWFPPLIAVRDAKLLYGWEAYTAQFEAGWTVIRSIKRSLENAGPCSYLEIENQQIPLLDVLTGMASSLRSALVKGSSIPARTHETLEIMLGVPASANSNQRFLTVEAFQRAGFHVLGLLNEPSAASIEYGHRSRDGGAAEQLLVYDLGGGTFDVSLVRIDDRLHTVVATEGAADLGGDDFDELLASFALEAANLSSEDLTESELFRLHEECRSKKEALHPNTRRIIVDLSQVREDLTQIVIPAGDYYERCRPLVEKSISLTEHLLQMFGSEEGQVDSLYVTGGGSELPVVSRILKEVFGRRVRRSAYARSATAIGLAIQADEQAGYVLREIFHRHFGVWREWENGRHVVFDPLFPKGTPLPSRGESSIGIRRRYVPVHNIGHFRYLECTHTTGDNLPTGDLSVWDEIRFPFDPSLSNEADLQDVPVAHMRGIAEQLVEESYSVDAAGNVEVRIGNLTSNYSRVYRLGKWAAKSEPVRPGRRHRRRPEAASSEQIC
ncbi:MAG: Hsp70 family protein [Bryobacteraceae bacterium]|nr:Hsp70 family protein [Bryobacteraceae bacterium]